MRAYIPNLLSSARILSSFLFPYLNPGIQRGILLLFIILSDVLDGFLARRYNAISKLGTLLDPIGDKIVAVVVTLTFLYEGLLLPWQSVCLFTREMALILFFIGMKIAKKWNSWTIQSFWIGKIVTSLQFISFLLLSFGFCLPQGFYLGMCMLGFSCLGELSVRAYKNKL